VIEQARPLRHCTELAARAAGVVVATLVMSGLLLWVWTTEITPQKVVLAWLGWCAAILVQTVAVSSRRPHAGCYALAVVPAASPYLAVLGFYWFWRVASAIS
jgi:hypothetical protein